MIFVTAVLIFILPTSQVLWRELFRRLLQSIPVSEFTNISCRFVSAQGSSSCPENRHVRPDLPTEAATPTPRAPKSLYKEELSHRSYSTPRRGCKSRGQRQPREMRLLLLNPQSAAPTAQLFSCLFSVRTSSSSLLKREQNITYSLILS